MHFRAFLRIRLFHPLVLALAWSCAAPVAHRYIRFWDSISPDATWVVGRHLLPEQPPLRTRRTHTRSVPSSSPLDSRTTISLPRQYIDAWERYMGSGRGASQPTDVAHVSMLYIVALHSARYRYRFLFIPPLSIYPSATRSPIHRRSSTSPACFLLLL